MAFDAATYEIDPLTLTTPRARLEYLRDFLRRLPGEKFNMGLWQSRNGGTVGYRLSADEIKHDCDTAACIGGWCEAIWPGPSAYTTLGLGDEGIDLFYPGPMADGSSGYAAKPAEAAAVLDHLLNTGEVDWSVARKAQSNG